MLSKKFIPKPDEFYLNVSEADNNYADYKYCYMGGWYSQRTGDIIRNFIETMRSFTPKSEITDAAPTLDEEFGKKVSRLGTLKKATEQNIDKEKALKDISKIHHPKTYTLEELKELKAILSTL